MIDQINGLQDDLEFLSSNQDIKKSQQRNELLRREKEEKDKKITQMLSDYNILQKVQDHQRTGNQQRIAQILTAQGPNSIEKNALILV